MKIELYKNQLNIWLGKIFILIPKEKNFRIEMIFFSLLNLKIINRFESDVFVEDLINSLFYGSEDKSLDTPESFSSILQTLAIL
ncbi:hypothetical protein BpHYR1_045113 [Brachionus plicatilis]|uniref:Uncharacterized protein n=1 Tax=Brachionus plicatilis TaxID=10195 RepID=A0A3M7SY23_BRAPC|nr:hypothetical protein BpHYR1_045113 [Brachionus plicatilis]